MKNLKSQLNNLTEDTLNIQIEGKIYTTNLEIKKYRHRPFELEVKVDHSISKDKSKSWKINQRKSSQSRSGFSNQFRYLWIFFILGGIIINLINLASGRFYSLLDFLLPGRTIIQQAGIIISLAIVFFVIGIFLPPIITKALDTKKREFDEEIYKLVTLKLHKLIQENSSVKIRCWSCFQKINYNDSICPFCNVQQN